MAKTIKLIQGETFSSKQAFIDVVRLPPQGCDLVEMKKRWRVLEALEAAGDDEVTLEDADYELLKSAYNSNRFPVVHKDLLAIADTLQ
jgi:hypothetical protein